MNTSMYVRGAHAEADADLPLAGTFAGRRLTEADPMVGTFGGTMMTEADPMLGTFDGSVMAGTFDESVMAGTFDESVMAGSFESVMSDKADEYASNQSFRNTRAVLARSPTSTCDRQKLACRAGVAAMILVTCVGLMVALHGNSPGSQQTSLVPTSLRPVKRKAQVVTVVQPVEPVVPAVDTTTIVQDDDWTERAVNCYPGSGGEVVLLDGTDGSGPDAHVPGLSLEECKSLCNAQEKCEAVVFTTNAFPSRCYGRAIVDADKCVPFGQDYIMEFKTSRTKHIPDGMSDGSWCQASLPDDFNLNTCNSVGAPLEVKILTYNLYWWNLFGVHHGAHGSAGQLIASAAEKSKAFDLMGFQECQDISRVLTDAGMRDEFGTVVGPHSIALAYRKASWTALEHGVEDVAEDRKDQWYGRRSVVWVRLQHASTGRTIFFMNHHGPLPVNSGGVCGGAATVYNVLKVAKDNMDSGDVVILTGDFNSDSHSLEIQLMRQRIHEVATGTVFNGIDHVFSNCAGLALQRGMVPGLETRELAGGAGATVVETRDLGSGGSDHHAIEAVVSL